VKKTRLMVDGHVHIYDCYDLDRFFTFAVNHLEYFYNTLYANGSPYERILLLTEAKGHDFFTLFRERGCWSGDSPYRFLKTKEEESLILTRDNKRLCYLVKGRQIVCRENLEVMATASKQNIADGLPIESVIRQIVEKQELAVLAWGVGKWWFKRGKILKALVEKHDTPYLLLGDNSGRPGFWPVPAVFKRALALKISIINGSDPLPFKGEEAKVGSYGFSLEGEFEEDEPAKSLRDLLASLEPGIGFFGRRDNMFSFFQRQAKIYLKKYLASQPGGGTPAQ
jgi:hypothetical protein